MIGLSFIGLLVCMLSHQILTANTVHITTINSYDAQSVVITYRGKATVVNVANDGYLNYTLSNFLDGKNINSIDSFIELEKSTDVIGDFAYLSQTKNIKNLIIDEKNQVNRYCDDKLKKCSIMPIDQNLKYSFAQVAKVNVENSDYGATVWVSVGGVKVCITTDEFVAQESNCEFLYYRKKNIE